MTTLLNTSIITADGNYSLETIILKDAKELVQDGFQSAIGHFATAQIISELLEIECPVNRIIYHQKLGEVAVVFKMNGRPPEGKILAREEIERIGYTWKKLIRIS